MGSGMGSGIGGGIGGGIGSGMGSGIGSGGLGGNSVLVGCMGGGGAAEMAGRRGGSLTFDMLAQAAPFRFSPAVLPEPRHPEALRAQQ
eukprot:254598-Pleurochrysis_carterae.AAC.1